MLLFAVPFNVLHFENLTDLFFHTHKQSF